MTKAAIVVLADTEAAGELGRVVNALTTAKEFKESGDEVAVVFDGAGTRWVPALSDSGHKYSDLFEAVRDRVAGACEYCSQAYGVKDDVEETGIDLLGDYEHHPSLHSYAEQGYQVITF
ncbi:MAG: DsrE family protein [Solirubrobacterales bacterium]